MAVRKTTSSKALASPNRGGRTSMTYDDSRRMPTAASPNRRTLATDSRVSRASNSARGVRPSATTTQRRTSAPVTMNRTATPRTTTAQKRTATKRK